MPKPRKIQYNGDSKIVNALVNVANWVLDARVDDLNNVGIEELADGQILKYNSTTQLWENSEESGGTVVVANPTGTATDELDTIQIGATIYDIVGGGGGGGGDFTETVLYRNTTGEYNTTVTLSDSIDNYDLIAFFYGVYSEFTSLHISDYRLVTVSDLNAAHTEGMKIILTGWSTRVMYVDANENHITTSNESENILCMVKGIKLPKGGSGGGGSYTETELYTGTSIVATVNLSESFESFDAVQFTTGFLYSGRTYLVTSTFTKGDMADALANQKWLKMGHSTDSYCYGKVAANNQFTDCYGLGNLYSIKGIKYGGGSGGGSSKRDILYTANAQADTYSLAHPLTDYDEIWCFVVGGASGVFATSRVFDCDTLMEYAGIDMRFGITTDGWYSYFMVTDENTLVRADTGGFWMKKIIGIKN